MKLVNIIIALAIIFLILLPFIDSFQGTSSSYTVDVNYDSFTSNGSSTTMTQRFIGGTKPVSTYLSTSYLGRWGILNYTCNGDYGAWSAWSSCSGGQQSRTRTDSAGCVQTETQSCGGSSGTTECIPSWSAWSAWSECIDEEQTRTRSDGCGEIEEETRECGVELICNDNLDNDLDGLIDCDDGDCDENPACIICVPEWDCSWSNCSDDSNGTYYSSPYDCIDLNDCGIEEGLPENVLCEYDDETGEYISSMGCRTEWDCDEWSACKLDYNLQDILKGKPIVKDIQTRVCNDLGNCKQDKIDFRECSMAIPVEARKTEWCDEEYVDIYEIKSNLLVSRIREMSVIETSQLNIGFFVSEFEGYCDYCFNGIQDYDETGIDCGGANCPSCVDRGTYFDWLYYVKIGLWTLFILLILYLIYKNKDKILGFFTMKRRVLKPHRFKVLHRKLIVHRRGRKKKGIIGRLKRYSIIQLQQDFNKAGYKMPRKHKLKKFS